MFELKPCPFLMTSEEVIRALMDLRDAWIAKQPRSEWYKDKTAQGVEKGIEMCIARIREMAKDD